MMFIFSEILHVYPHFVNLDLTLLQLYFYSYITRYNVKDSSKHIVLGTQQFKPSEFGAQVTS